ncbi:MAG TPA: hypothetical protein VG738_00460 [Chitinophagaceae bacterium]|nr:hypothetical protein [Chitinophagaceae bacterium]
MATIMEDINTFTDMITKGFKADKFILDYTLSSFKEVDRFYELNSRNGEVIDGGRFSKNLGQILFALGAYIGQTIIKLIPGTVWETNENDPEGEINAALMLPGGAKAWPMQRAIKRFKNGEEDGIYVYGYHIVSQYLNNIEELLAKERAKKQKKPLWKFW